MTPVSDYIKAVIHRKEGECLTGTRCEYSDYTDSYTLTTIEMDADGEGQTVKTFEVPSSNVAYVERIKHFTEKEA